MKNLLVDFKNFRNLVIQGSKESLQKWVTTFQASCAQVIRNAGALLGDTPYPYFFRELHRLDPTAPVIHMTHPGAITQRLRPDRPRAEISV